MYNWCFGKQVLSRATRKSRPHKQQQVNCTLRKKPENTKFCKHFNLKTNSIVKN